MSSRNLPDWVWLHGATSSLSWATPKLGCPSPELGSNSTATNTSRSISVTPSLCLFRFYFFPPSLYVCVTAPVRSDLSISYWITLNHATKNMGRGVLMSHPLHIKTAEDGQSHFLVTCSFLAPCGLQWKRSHPAHLLSLVLCCQFGIPIF